MIISVFKGVKSLLLNIIFLITLSDFITVDEFLLIKVSLDILSDLLKELDDIKSNGLIIKGARLRATRYALRREI